MKNKFILISLPRSSFGAARQNWPEPAIDWRTFHPAASAPQEGLSILILEYGDRFCVWCEDRCKKSLKHELLQMKGPGGAGGSAIRAIQNHLSICWQLKIIPASSINKSAKEHVPLGGWVSSAPSPFLLGLLIAAATALSAAAAGFATK